MSELNPLSEDLYDIAVRSEDFIQDLEGSRILITGGTGFFGKWILMGLCYLNDQFSLSLKAEVISRSPDNFQRNHQDLSNHRSINLVKGNIIHLNPNLGTFSHIIHGAADTSPSKAAIGEVAPTILEGTSNILNYYGNSNVDSLIFLSSGAVYGEQPANLDKITEGKEINLLTLKKEADSYGLAKRQAELMILDDSLHSIKRVIVSRCFCFLGPLMRFDQQFAVGNFIRSAIEENNITLKSDGTSVRTYMYVGDLVVWLLKMLIRGPDKTVLNTGCDQEISVKDSATVVSQLRPQAVPVILSDKQSRTRVRYVPSIEAAKDILDLKVWTNYATSVKKTMQWYERNRFINRH